VDNQRNLEYVATVSDRGEAGVTPDEIRHIQLNRSLRGYDITEVDRLLEEVASDFGELVSERDDLRERVARLEKGLEEYNEIEHLMREALVSAQRTADDLRDRTQRECEELLTNARQEADRISGRATEERARAEQEIQTLRSQERELRASYRVLLHAALDRLGEAAEGEAAAAPTLLEALAPKRLAAEASLEASAAAAEADQAAEAESDETALAG